MSLDTLRRLAQAVVDVNDSQLRHARASKPLVDLATYLSRTENTWTQPAPAASGDGELRQVLTDVIRELQACATVAFADGDVMCSRTMARIANTAQDRLDAARRGRNENRRLQ